MLPMVFMSTMVAKCVCEVRGVKGKGVRYQGEYVKLKAGKAAGKGAK